jgi:hypothetical protein
MSILIARHLQAKVDYGMATVLDFQHFIEPHHQRIGQAINYMRINPADPVLGPPPWSLRSSAFEQTISEH